MLPGHEPRRLVRYRDRRGDSLAGLASEDASAILINSMNHNVCRHRVVTCASFYLALCLCQGFGQTESAATAKPNDPSKVRVLVAYYFLSGNTEKMANGVVEGVKRVAGVGVSLKKVDEVTKDDLESADGIVLGCPTYYGTLPGKMKAVINDWSWRMKVNFTDKVGGAFSTGGGQVGGKEFAVISLVMFMLNNRMVVAGPLYRNEQTGSVWGEVGAAAMTGPLDPGVSEGELDSARRLGERVARLAAKLKRAATQASEQ